MLEYEYCAINFNDCNDAMVIIQELKIFNLAVKPFLKCSNIIALDNERQTNVISQKLLCCVD